MDFVIEFFACFSMLRGRFVGIVRNGFGEFGFVEWSGTD